MFEKELSTRLEKLQHLLEDSQKSLVQKRALQNKTKSVSCVHSLYPVVLCRHVDNLSQTGKETLCLGKRLPKTDLPGEPVIMAVLVSTSKHTCLTRISGRARRHACNLHNVHNEFTGCKSNPWLSSTSCATAFTTGQFRPTFTLQNNTY